MNDDDQVIDGEDQSQCESSASAVGEVSIATPRVVNRTIGDSFTDEAGIVWMKLPALIAHFGANDRFSRNVRLWVTPDKDTGRSKVPGKQLEKGKRAPWYVDFEALVDFLMEKYKKQISRYKAQADDEPLTDEEALHLALINDGYIDSEGQPAQMELASPAIATVFEQVRELNADWRNDMAEQSSKVEEVLTEQLEHERNKIAELQKEVIDLRVKLEVKELTEVVETEGVNLLDEEEHQRGFWSRLMGR